MNSGTTALFACVWLLGGRTAAWGQSNNAGTGGAQFLKLEQGSARAQALGQAYVALAEGADALTWNPAGLALSQQKEVAYSYQSNVQGTDSPLYIGYAHPMGRTVWGANLAYLSVSNFDVRDANGVPQTSDNVYVRDGFATIAMARSFWYEKLFLGGALRVVHEDLASEEHDTLVGDVGILLKPNSVLTLGFAVQNFGSSVSNVPSTTRGGAALRLGDFFNLGLELNQSADSGAHFGVGGEFLLPEQYLDVGQISFRVGYYNADSLGESYSNTLKDLQLDRSAGLSFGFGLFTSRAFGYGLTLDYAFVPFGALGTVDQFTFKVKF
jgi:hypothetical protein